MRRLIHRPIRATVLALAGCLVGCGPLVACAGPSENPAEPADPVGAAGGGTAGPPSSATGVEALEMALVATRAVPTGRVDVTTVIEGLGGDPDAPPGGRALVVVHRLVFDRRTAGTPATEVVTELSPLAADGPAGPGPLRLVVVGDRVYSQLGPVAGTYGLAPTDWVETDRGHWLRQGPDSETATLAFDPLAPLAVLDTALGAARAEDVRVVGEGEVRGVPVVRHAVRPPEGPALAVALDAAGLIRRFELRVAAEGRAGEVVTRVDLFDLGEPVAVEAPEVAAQPPRPSSRN